MSRSIGLSLGHHEDGSEEEVTERKAMMMEKYKYITRSERREPVKIQPAEIFSLKAISPHSNW